MIWQLGKKYFNYAFIVIALHSILFCSFHLSYMMLLSNSLLSILYERLIIHNYVLKVNKWFINAL